MSGYWGHAAGLVTAFLLIAFLAIWIWAWLPRHKEVFDRMARVPLDNEEQPTPPEDAASVEGADAEDEQPEGGRKR